MKKSLVVLVAGGILLGSGCLSRDQREEAQAIALGDPPFAAYLTNNPYTVTEVRRPTYSTTTDAVVEIAFDVPANVYDEWPLSNRTACDFPGTTPAAIGIRWVVNVETDEVVVVTPLWEVTEKWPVESCHEA